MTLQAKLLIEATRDALNSAIYKAEHNPTIRDLKRAVPLMRQSADNLQNALAIEGKEGEPLQLPYEIASMLRTNSRWLSRHGLGERKASVHAWWNGDAGQPQGALVYTETQREGDGAWFSFENVPAAIAWALKHTASKPE